MRYTSLIVGTPDYEDDRTMFYKITRRRMEELTLEAARAAQRRGGVIYATFYGKVGLYRCDATLPAPAVELLAGWEQELLEAAAPPITIDPPRSNYETAIDPAFRPDSWRFDSIRNCYYHIRDGGLLMTCNEHDRQAQAYDARQQMYYGTDDAPEPAYEFGGPA